MNRKSSPAEIRERFDNDVERFSNLETGQSATVDAVLSLDLVAQAAQATNAEATHVLDLGCGAGNFTLRLLRQGIGLKHVTLVDLSQPMLDRAIERLSSAADLELEAVQSDLREIELADEKYDIVLAAAVLHHLRDESEWQATLQKIFQAIRPGGSLWIFDLVRYQSDVIHAMMWSRYGDYLVELRDEEYRNHVFQYIEIEDSPRPLFQQLCWLAEAGFEEIEVLHSNTCFAAFGGIRPL